MKIGLSKRSLSSKQGMPDQALQAWLRRSVDSTSLELPAVHVDKVDQQDWAGLPGKLALLLQLLQRQHTSCTLTDQGMCTSASGAVPAV